VYGSSVTVHLLSAAQGDSLLLLLHGLLAVLWWPPAADVLDSLQPWAIPAEGSQWCLNSSEQ